MTNNSVNKFNAKLTGWFFIIAAVSSIVELKLYDPILTDSNFILSAKDYSSQIIWGAVNEIILVASAIGTGITLFPLLKTYSDSIGLGYLSFRLLEVVFISIGTISVLTSLSISQYYLDGLIKSKEDVQNLMLTFIGIHKWAFMIGPNFMLAINTFLYSYVFLITRVVPKSLAKLGIIASVLIMIAAFLELFGLIKQISTWGILLAMPIAIFEMTLAVWLINKGIITFSEI